MGTTDAMRSLNSWFLHASILLSSCLSVFGQQTVRPSNSTQDVAPEATSPRFWVNGTGLAFRVAPLGLYAQISHSEFTNIELDGKLTLVDEGSTTIASDSFSYMSCDPEDHSGMIDATGLYRLVSTSQSVNGIILYSTRSNHCTVMNMRRPTVPNGIFTTLDPEQAAAVVARLEQVGDPVSVGVRPDLNAYTNYSTYSPGWGNGSSHRPSTAIAMIVLYTIIGIIIALFIVIIITGAIRAHRHPDRYGPRNIAGRSRQSRAKGIARAMLETLPIVKFGDPDDKPKEPGESNADVEMTAENVTSQTKPRSAESDKATDKGIENTMLSDSDSNGKSTSTAVAKSNADGTDETGQLGCSICTEDFSRGEEVRVLPCNHKFHPECVDPWLLNVSGTCPLCRIDLRPKEMQDSDADATNERRGSTATLGAASSERANNTNGNLTPPLSPAPNGATRRETVYSLRQIAAGTREERIAALRRFRQQRRARNSVVPSGGADGGSAVIPSTDDSRPHQQDEEERRGLARRLRERFMVRTRRQGESLTENETGESGGSSPQRPSP